MSEVSVVQAGRIAPAVAELFVEATAGAAAARGKAVVAVTGGSTAQPLYAALREPPFRGQVPWQALQIFPGDERAVPPDDPRSNWGLLARELLAHVPLPSAQLHRLRGEAPDLDGEAARARAELRAVAGDPPRLDLLLLSLGTDGHLLSCFPGVPSSADRGDRALVRHVAAPAALEPRVERLTLTPFVLVTARTVVVQAAGAAKSAALARALKGPEDLVACPAQWLRRAVGRVVVIADEAAAASL